MIKKYIAFLRGINVGGNNKVEMSKLILTSSVHAVANDIAKKLNLTTKNKLVFITTAAEAVTGDMSWLENDRNSLINAGFMVTNYTITGKNYDQLRTDLANYDYIYVSGGNAPYLLEQSFKSGFNVLIKELVNKDGKIYIGTSAGSILAGPKCPEYLYDDGKLPDEINQLSYNFVNFTVLPHWGSVHFKNRYLGERLEIAYKEKQVPLLLLTDTQYVVVENDKFVIITVDK